MATGELSLGFLCATIYPCCCIRNNGQLLMMQTGENITWYSMQCIHVEQDDHVYRKRYSMQPGYKWKRTGGDSRYELYYI